MPFNYSEALNSIRAKMTLDGEVYTEEMFFMVGAVNRFTCMGGSNYNPGTTKILDEVFDKEGAREAVRLLFLVQKATYKAPKSIGHKFFWDLYKSCNEDISAFKRQLESYSHEWKDTEHLIPESIKTQF